MKVIDPGHVYDLDWLDGSPLVAEANSQGDVVDQGRLTFVKREGDGYPGNVGHHPGTNMQEVLRVLIDRLKYLDNQVPDHRNLEVIRNFRVSLWLLEQRAADRHQLDWGIGYQMDVIENLPTCPKCRHIACMEIRGGCG